MSYINSVLPKSTVQAATVSDKKDGEIPYFCWDRQDTVADIKRKLNGPLRNQTMAWLLREAKFCDVWSFVSPQEVNQNLNEIKQYLGKSKDFWIYIIGEWHELGKL